MLEIGFTLFPIAVQVTYIIPSYRQGRFIGQCLDSIACQGLRRDQFEILVFDGGSTDSTIDKLTNHALKPTWVSRADAGQGAAINDGLTKAKGEIIAWINSDDFYYPDAIRQVIQFFKKRSEAEIVFGRGNYVDEESNVIEEYKTERWDFNRLADFCFVCQPAVFFRRSIPEKYGYVDESLRVAMDYEYWLRIGKHQPFHRLEAVLAASRLHNQSKTLLYRKEVNRESLSVSHRHTGRWSKRWVRAIAQQDVNVWAQIRGHTSPTLLWLLRRLNYFRYKVQIALHGP